MKVGSDQRLADRKLSGSGDSTDVEARLGKYLAELRRWGERINLVGSTESDQLQMHARDALAAAPHLEPGMRVADLGSGGGLPGVPLAIARPDVHFVLVEVRERRVHFLRHVVRQLGLRCDVWRQRIEAGPRPEAGRFDVVLARAVGPPPEVLRMALDWVKEDGEIWLWTREDAAACGAASGEKISIDAEGARGHVLRVPARAIPRGTVR